MKFIVAIIKPYKSEDVMSALVKVGLEGMTVSEVRGAGRNKHHADLLRGSQFVGEFLPEIKLEVAVTDEMTEKAIAAITRAARTGKTGDGKIFVLPMADAIRISTGERGDVAI
jgi:nitrogen regulatory protein PII